MLKSKLLISLLLLTITRSVFAMAPDKSQDGIPIKKSSVQHVPKDSSIQASINGHVLTVTFTENLGTVQVEITTATGGTVDYGHIWTPDSYIAYITNTGSYVVTITLPNGDEYYGEFDVTD
jgi:hypothetical protein